MKPNREFIIFVKYIFVVIPTEALCATDSGSERQVTGNR